MEWNAVSRKIEQHSRRLEELEAVQAARRRYLAFRVREIYKDGAEQEIQRILGGDPVEEFLEGLRYASFLNRRDSRVLDEFRADIVRLAEERDRLRVVERELASAREELERARRALASARGSRERMLRRVRQDQSSRGSAIAELERAATEMSRLIDSLQSRGAATLDIRKFRKLLDWPADGRVSAGFGTVIHPRFKTRVPHPGLDIEGDVGADIRAVFDGRVVFADWMRGYGLTAILDHGQGVLSVYAHASALLVEPGDRLLGGQRIGLIGDTGSLRGPYLYFELRVDGRPVDPRDWLRPVD